MFDVEREKKVKILVENLMRIPDEKFDYVMDHILAIVQRYASNQHYDLIINVNASAHHNIREAVSRQFTFNKYVDLTHGNLKFKQIMEIPKLIMNTLKNAYGRIGVVLTGHPLMQFLALGTIIASRGEATAMIWLTNLSLYHTRNYKKFRPTVNIEPIKNDYDIIIPTQPFTYGILNKFDKAKIHVVCEEIDDTETWEKCYKETVSLLIGNKKAHLLIDAPMGLPATIATEIVECMGLDIKILTVINGDTKLLEVSHKSFRNFNFKYKSLTPRFNVPTLY